MNSRFKFRVWDKAENKYNGFSFHLATSGELDRLSVDGDLLATDEDRFIIEQCTGLKDYNGNLIYEGDIVKTAIGEIGVVVFFDAQFAVRFENAFYCSVAEAKEIIGNIIHEDQFRDLTELKESEVEDE